VKLTDDQAKWLRWLEERGGRGFLDRWGRVVAAGETSPQGACVAWLNLCAKGQLHGADGVLLVAPTKPHNVQSDADKSCSIGKAQRGEQ
jgi:hypothetical protein